MFMNNKINVLHFSLSPNLGGIETFLYNLFSNIDRDKFDFSFVTDSEQPAMGKELEALGGKIIKVAPHKQLLKYIKDIRNIVSQNYNIIHFHKNSAADILAIMLAKRYSNAKIIVHSHNTAPSVGQSKLIMAFHKLNQPYINKVADRRLACSEIAADWLFGVDASDRNEVRIIHNGIPSERFRFSNEVRQEVRKELHVTEDALLLGNIGRLSMQKNQQYLLNVFALLKKRRPDAELYLCGTGSEQENLAMLAQSLGVEADVHFMGARNDVHRLLQGFDVVLMPSLYEGLGISAIEAQAAGCPIIVSPFFPKETDISDIFFRLPLDTDYNTWVDKCLKVSKLTHVDRSAEVIGAGFEAENMGHDVSEIYQEMIDQETIIA